VILRLVLELSKKCKSSLIYSYELTHLSTIKLTCFEVLPC
jgi:hypothetical protein